MDKFSEEAVTIKVIKHFYMGEPSHWSAEVDDTDGEPLGIVTGPSFYGVWDEALGFITGDTDDFSGDQHNEWVDFDANSGVYSVSPKESEMSDPRRAEVWGKKPEVADRTLNERKFCKVCDYYYSEMFTCPICYGAEQERKRLDETLSGWQNPICRCKVCKTVREIRQEMKGEQ